jgi:hypothetical protein
VPQVVASQVKEKYGTLRFYIAGGDEFIEGMIAFAETISGHTCEKCGKPGKLIDRAGWWTTQCIDCRYVARSNRASLSEEEE